MSNRTYPTDRHHAGSHVRVVPDPKAFGAGAIGRAMRTLEKKLRVEGILREIRVREFHRSNRDKRMERKRR